MLAAGLAAAGAIGVLFIFLGLQRLASSDLDMGARLDQLIGRVSTASAKPAEGRQGPLSAGIERAVAGHSFAAGVARDLARADLKLTVAEYIMINVLLVISLAALALAISGNLVAVLGFGAVGLFLPRVYIGMRQGRRLSAFNRQLADTCGLLANSLRSGYSLLQSMEMVAREGTSPTKEEFARVVREVGLGLTPEQALANLVRRISSDDLDLMVTAINVQHEVGGNLAQILDTISHTIRERVKVKGEIKTLTAQVSCSGNVVSVLPIALTLILFLLNPSYVSQIFQPGLTLCMPAAAAGGIVSGWLAMRKITQIEV